MPQMAPMNWLTLFIYFTVIFLMVNSVNYFMFLYPVKSEYKYLKKPQISWKW